MHWEEPGPDDYVNQHPVEATIVCLLLVSLPVFGWAAIVLFDWLTG